MILLSIRPTHLVGWWKVNVDSSSNIFNMHLGIGWGCTQLSVFTCSLWERHDHVMESHVSERCYRACSTQGEGHNGHWPQKSWIYFGCITAIQKGCQREIRDIIRCLSDCEWVTDEVCTACAKNKAKLMHFKQLSNQIIISRIIQPYNVLTIETYSPTFVEQLKLY